MNKLSASTKMSEIAERYGADFGEDNDLTIAEFLIKRGYPSLARLFERKNERDS